MALNVGRGRRVEDVIVGGLHGVQNLPQLLQDAAGINDVRKEIYIIYINPSRGTVGIFMAAPDLPRYRMVFI